MPQKLLSEHMATEPMIKWSVIGLIIMMGSTAIIPPRRNGQYRAGAPDYFLERDKSLLEIKGLGEVRIHESSGKNLEVITEEVLLKRACIDLKYSLEEI